MENTIHKLYNLYYAARVDQRRQMFLEESVNDYPSYTWFGFTSSIAAGITGWAATTFTAIEPKVISMGIAPLVFAIAFAHSVLTRHQQVERLDKFHYDYSSTKKANLYESVLNDKSKPEAYYHEFVANEEVISYRPNPLLGPTVNEEAYVRAQIDVLPKSFQWDFNHAYEIRRLDRTDRKIKPAVQEDWKRAVDRHNLLLAKVWVQEYNKIHNKRVTQDDDYVKPVVDPEDDDEPGHLQC